MTLIGASSVLIWRVKSSQATVIPQVGSTEDIAPYANLVVRQDLYDAGIDGIEKLAAWKRPDGSRPIVAVPTIGAGTWIWGTFLFEKIGKGSGMFCLVAA